MNGSPTDALRYFKEGAQTIIKPGYRRYVLIPLLANIVLFVAITLLMLRLLGGVIDDIDAVIPSWLTWFTWIIWPLVGFVFLVIYGYSFNVITNIIAAPFFGFLVEKLQRDRLGLEASDEPLDQLILRTLTREITKLWYFISRGILVCAVFILLFFVPGANVLGSVLWGIWGMWCMSVQYMDYPADTNKVPFRELRRKLNEEPLTSYSYGGIILLGSMIPVINIVIAPIAVTGAAIYWIERFGNTHAQLPKYSAHSRN